MEKRLVTNAGPFRYAFLKTLAASSHVFSRPHALGKLCAFVVAAHRESGKWKGKTARPFVLCVQNPFRDVYTVVGVPCPRRFGEVERKCVCLSQRRAVVLPPAALTGTLVPATVNLAWCFRWRRSRSRRGISMTGSSRA